MSNCMDAKFYQQWINGLTRICRDQVNLNFSLGQAGARVVAISFRAVIQAEGKLFR